MIVSQPAETVRSLTESKRQLAEIRHELAEDREYNFHLNHPLTRLPGFFPRNAEMQALERVLGEEPTFMVVLGASSVGKVGSIQPLSWRKKADNELVPRSVSLFWLYSRLRSYEKCCLNRNIMSCTSIFVSLVSQTYQACTCA